jgi:integrase
LTRTTLGSVSSYSGELIFPGRYLSVAESQKLINAAQGDFRILVQAALQTGARYQELARLRVSDFDSAVGTLHIRKTKTHKDRHIILTEGREFFSQLAAGRPGSALLLGKEWKPSHQAPLILKACKQASIDPPLNFHATAHLGELIRDGGHAADGRREKSWPCRHAHG